MEPVVDCVDEVVLTEDLAPLIKEAIERRWATWRREWQGGGARDGTRVAFGPLQRICFEADISLRQLARIVSREANYVDVLVADKLLSALDLHLTSVDVYPRAEARNAVVEQAALVRLIARANGIFVPPFNRWDDKAKREIPKLRRQMLGIAA